MPRKSPKTPQALANLGAATARGALPRTGALGRSSGCAVSRLLGAGSSGQWSGGAGGQTAAQRPHTQVNTYLYKAEAALFSPLGLLGLGSPAMLMSARKGHAAVTRHVPRHLHPHLGTEPGPMHTALPERNELPHTPTHSHLLLACLGPVEAPEEGKHILPLGKPLPFPFQSHSPFSVQSAPCSNPHTQTQDSFLGRTRCDKAKSKPAACCWLLTIHPLILWE